MSVTIHGWGGGGSGGGWGDVGACRVCIVAGPVHIRTFIIELAAPQKSHG